MKFAELLTELDKLNLPKGQYAITSSGPMGIRGIRESRDIDVIVTDKLWEELIQKYPISEKEIGPVLEISEIVQVIGNLRAEHQHKTRSNDELIRDADIIDGYRFVKLDDVIKFKTALGRDKDHKDIELITQYLKTI